MRLNRVVKFHHSSATFNHEDILERLLIKVGEGCVDQLAGESLFNLEYANIVLLYNYTQVV